VGPSGCGKSTLIRNIAGLDHATSGEVRVYGERVAGPGADRGMVFQRYTLFPWLTVKRNVMFGLLRMGKDRKTAAEEARRWIEIVGLEGFTNAYPSQLSGGMKQRVAIARALAVQPRVLLMDEPFGALDAQTRSQMQAYLLQIWRNVDVTILFITHDLDEAVYLSDRILVLKSHPGEIQEIVEVPVARPREAAQFISPAFLASVQHIKDLIHPPAGEDEILLPIPKMTADGDEVE
jgi:NitT/TauT family transport system ATP-binding protein